MLPSRWHTAFSLGQGNGKHQRRAGVPKRVKSFREQSTAHEHRQCLHTGLVQQRQRRQPDFLTAAGVVVMAWGRIIPDMLSRSCVTRRTGLGRRATPHRVLHAIIPSLAAAQYGPHCRTSPGWRGQSTIGSGRALFTNATDCCLGRNLLATNGQRFQIEHFVLPRC